MTRYSLARQALRIFSVLASLCIYGTMPLADWTLGNQLGLLAAAAVAGLIVSTAVPNRILRWALDKQMVGGAFVLSLQVTFGIAVTILIGMILSELGTLRWATVFGGFAVYLVMAIPFIVGVALLGWYPMIAILHYLRQKRDFV